MSRVSFNFLPDESDEDESSIGASAISESYFKERRSSDFRGPRHSGYLLRLGPDRSWKRRYFETNGFYLTYFKSKKRGKLLGALNLMKVISIALSTSLRQDEKGCIFHIEVHENLYTLRASSPLDCERWVNVLNDLRNGIDYVRESITEEPEESVANSLLPRSALKQQPKSGVWQKFKFICCFA